MTESKHTPGPWKASQTHPVGDWCVHAPGVPWQLAYLASSTQTEWPLEANARLIAAAPDLLEAILNSDDAHWTPAMRAAIAKATKG